jgi:hypothetical protein
MLKGNSLQDELRNALGQDEDLEELYGNELAT